MTLERLSIVLGMLGLAFAAGANWHRIDGVEAAIVGLSKQADSFKVDYERKDVLEQQLKNIDEKLADIKQRIAGQK